MAPRVEPEGALLVLDDPAGRWDSVSLRYHLRPPYPDRSFARTERGWGYWLDRPDVDRVEYLIEQTDPAGTTRLSLDETNPLRAPGAFGDHSVLEFPGYAPPGWLEWPAPPGQRLDLTLPHGRGLRRELPVQVWSPDGLGDAAAPLLLAHDGPELDRYSSLTRYSSAMIQAGRLPPHRVGLLAPLDRDAWYSASPAYARSLSRHAVPALERAVPTVGAPVLVGVSLGALAGLHAEWSAPGTFAALFLASGSFFQMRYDSHEQSYGRFFRIVSAVESVVDTPTAPSEVRVAMVCGTGEENWENNRVVADALRRMGVDPTFTPFRDGHTWVGWRDSFHPALTTLLTGLWGEHPGH